MHWKALKSWTTPHGSISAQYAFAFIGLWLIIYHHIVEGTINCNQSVGWFAVGVCEKVAASLAQKTVKDSVKNVSYWEVGGGRPISVQDITENCNITKYCNITGERLQKTVILNK